MPEDMDLAARYSRWDTEDLARSVTTEASEFTPEALTAMRRELERRGSAAGAKQLMAAGPPASAAEAPRGVGGFLRLLMFLFGLMSITVLVGALDARRGAASRLIDVVGACVGAYGVVCWVLLMRLDRRAPSLAALWFVAVAVLALVDALHDYRVTGTVTPDLLTIFYCGLWITYLTRSRRVRATFGSTAGW